MAVSLIHRVSASDYLAGEWPANSQLVEGEVVVNDPSFGHQRIVLGLLSALTIWVAAEPGRGLAGFGGNWRVGGDNVFKPDAWWTSPERSPSDDLAWMEGAPDLAVEVRSPRTWRYDFGAKKAGYEAAGCAELWLVDPPGRTVLVFRRAAPGSAEFDVAVEVDARGSLISPLLPGFALGVGTLFDPLR